MILVTAEQMRQALDLEDLVVQLATSKSGQANVDGS